MKARSLLWLAALSTTHAFTGSALAQEPLNVAVFPAATEDAALKPLAQALDPVVLGHMPEIPDTKVAAQPPLDLPATQLALDCIGETVACLRAVTEQAQAQALIAPSLERAGGETVVTILYFDARGEGALRSATRRHSGDNVERAALDAVPGMLKELFGVSEPAPAPAPASAQQPAAPLEPEPEEAPAEATAFPVVPVVITATGVGLLGVGVAFGLMSQASEDDYAGIHVVTEADAEAADDKLEKARTQAVIANVGMGVGAAVIAVGAALWIVELSDDEGGEEPRARIVPRIAPGEIGVAFSGHFGGAGS
jgi:hypothetical protein